MFPLSCEPTAYTSLSRPLVLCQLQLGFFYKYSAFLVLPFLRFFLVSVRQKGGGRVVSASGSSTPTSAIIYDVCTSMKKSFEGNEHSTQSHLLHSTGFNWTL